MAAEELVGRCELGEQAAAIAVAVGEEDFGRGDEKDLVATERASESSR